MRIEIKFVEVEQKTGKSGKPYNVAEVTYKSDRGETKSYRHFDFNDPSLFKTLSELSKGDVVEVQTVKNDKGYLDWTAVEKGGAAAPATPDAEGKPAKSAFMPDDQRQKLIVRQSSLGHAVAFHKGDEGSTLGDIFATAGAMVSFVYGELATLPADSDDDIPV